MKKTVNHALKNSNWQTWLSRGLVIIVLLLNLQAGILFVVSPHIFVGAFELAGMPGRAAVQGVGILFLMWQVPYVFAAVNPVRYKISLVSACLMQLIGLVGETLLLASIPVEYGLLRGSITRFIWFDAGGLVLLVIALGVVHKKETYKSDMF